MTWKKYIQPNSQNDKVDYNRKRDTVKEAVKVAKREN